jgi:hypothetical protein
MGRKVCAFCAAGINRHCKYVPRPIKDDVELRMAACHYRAHHSDNITSERPAEHICVTHASPSKRRIQYELPFRHVAFKAALKAMGFLTPEEEAAVRVREESPITRALKTAVCRILTLCRVFCVPDCVVVACRFLVFLVLLVVVPVCGRRSLRFDGSSDRHSSRTVADHLA